MSLEENKTLARRFIEDVWNAGAMDEAAELLAPDLISHNQPPGQTTTGSEGFIEYVRTFKQWHPQVRFSVEDTVAEGDRVATRVVIRHADGDYAGIGIIRVQNGRIVEQWADTNRLS